MPPCAESRRHELAETGPLAQTMATAITNDAANSLVTRFMIAPSLVDEDMRIFPIHCCIRMTTAVGICVKAQPGHQWRLGSPCVRLNSTSPAFAFSKPGSKTGRSRTSSIGPGAVLAIYTEQTFDHARERGVLQVRLDNSLTTGSTPTQPVHPEHRPLIALGQAPPGIKQTNACRGPRQPCRRNISAICAQETPAKLKQGSRGRPTRYPDTTATTTVLSGTPSGWVRRLA